MSFCKFTMMLFTITVVLCKNLQWHCLPITVVLCKNLVSSSGWKYQILNEKVFRRISARFSKCIMKSKTLITC